MAGYSGTPLAKKLGLNEGSRYATVAAPPGFAALVAPLPAGARLTELSEGRLDVIVLFLTERSVLESEFLAVARALQPAGGLWVAWPKRASKVPTDITEDVIREVCLPSGLVDNKVCAIDETWSGLRLVWRKELRQGLASVPSPPSPLV